MELPERILEETGISNSAKYRRRTKWTGEKGQINVKENVLNKPP